MSRPRANLVLRPRLIERLNEGLHGKLTLVSAPAGFGKTTLLSAWLAERQKAKGKRQECYRVRTDNRRPLLLNFSLFAGHKDSVAARWGS